MPWTKKINRLSSQLYVLVMCLRSSGSVVPLFRKQIKDGGPLTVTHRDVTRYFMTITEAAQLVIQAGALTSFSAEKQTLSPVHLLDMGKPVKIMDLAQRMIELSGYKVSDDMQGRRVRLR